MMVIYAFELLSVRYKETGETKPHKSDEDDEGDKDVEPKVC